MLRRLLALAAHHELSVLAEEVLEPDGGVVFTDAQFALTPLPDDSVSLRVDAAGATALTQLGRGGQALLWLLAVAATAWLGRTPTRAKPQPALE